MYFKNDFNSSIFVFVSILSENESDTIEKKKPQHMVSFGMLMHVYFSTSFF